MIRLEYMSAKMTRVHYGPENELAGAMDPGDEKVLVFIADEATVITGTRTEILDLLFRALLVVGEQ